MGLSLPKWITAIWTRNEAGQNFYDLTAAAEWGLKGNNLSIAQNHPILTPALLFVSKLFSQAEFSIIDRKTEKPVENHWLLNLLDNPNYYQTMPDLLESLLFMQIAQGKAVLYVKKTAGTPLPTALYLLDSDLISWPDDFKTKRIHRGNDKLIAATTIVYDKYNENLDIQIKDLLFFYDLPNSLQKNMFEVKSRLDGLKQTLINTHDSLLAKNIILKTNGKELISGEKDGFPFTPDEKKDAEALFHNDYGLGFKRKRGLITQAKVKWQSMHIALRDLGLDESVKVDGNLIYTALHIPKDIISLEAKKTTYNNFKESMVSYIQNEMKSTLDSTIAVLQSLLEPNEKMIGSYEHLPIMQFILIERYQGVKGRAEALTSLRKAGLQDDLALELTGFPKGTKLNELTQESNGENDTTTEEKIRGLLKEFRIETLNEIEEHSS